MSYADQVEANERVVYERDKFKSQVAHLRHALEYLLSEIPSSMVDQLLQEAIDRARVVLANV